jgi:hypothetical protein
VFQTMLSCFHFSRFLSLYMTNPATYVDGFSLKFVLAIYTTKIETGLNFDFNTKRLEQK